MPEQFSPEFIRQIIAAYNMNKTLIDHENTEYRELKVFVGMLRGAVQVAEPPNPDLVKTLSRLMMHMDNTHKMLERLHGLAKQAERVMQEYAE